MITLLISKKNKIIKTIIIILFTFPNIDGILSDVSDNALVIESAIYNYIII